jgi:HK97 family phage major capsid protein
MNSLTLAAVRKFKDGQNNYLWIPSFQQSTSGLLLGHAVAELADMDDLGANKLPVVIANFREGYQIVDGIGIRTIRDNLTTKGWVKFYTTKRYGGDVVNFEAFKILKCSV